MLLSIEASLADTNKLLHMQGPFDIAVVGEIDSLGRDLRAALLPISLLLKPGVCLSWLSDPVGRGSLLIGHLPTHSWITNERSVPLPGV